MISVSNTKLAILTLTVAGATAVACSSDGTPPAGEDQATADARRELLTNYATNIVAPDLQQFQDDADSLQAAVTAYAATPDPTTLLAAQEAWTTAMLQWQRLELMQLGPLAPASMATAGESYRDRIYSWPLTNSCRVDQETAENNFGDPEVLLTEGVNGRGLDALEYLLFVETTENSCVANADLNTSGDWAAISDVTMARAAHAVAVTADLTRSANSAVEAWTAFAPELGSAGDTSGLFANTRQPLNELTNALFYLEAELKDMKLGEPSGTLVCVDPTCPDALELPLSQTSLQAAIVNLDTFETIFTGGAGFGFDDLLDFVGAPEVSQSIQTAIVSAREALAQVDGPLIDALDNDHTDVVAAYEAVREITLILKTQFISILDLELPQRAEGDND